MGASKGRFTGMIHYESNEGKKSAPRKENNAMKDVIKKVGQQMPSIFILLGRENHPDRGIRVYETFYTDEDAAKKMRASLNKQDYDATYQKQLWSWEVEELYPAAVGASAHRALWMEGWRAGLSAVGPDDGFCPYD